MASYHMYRNTTLGHTLQESLDDFEQMGQISKALSAKILMQFDRSINAALSSRIKNRLSFKVRRPCARLSVSPVLTPVCTRSAGGSPQDVPLLRQRLDLCAEGRGVPRGAGAC